MRKGARSWQQVGLRGGVSDCGLGARKFGIYMVLSLTMSSSYCDICVSYLSHISSLFSGTL